jgi:hypothetical protein
MIIKEKYKIRHKILEGLRQQTIPYDSTEDINFSDIQVTLKTLANASNISEFKILQQIDYLSILKEIEIVWIENEARYLLLTKGQIALYDNKYIDEGKREHFGRLKDVIQLIAIIVGTVITLFTFISNYIDTRKNTKGIEEIKTELEQLRTMHNKK